MTAPSLYRVQDADGRGPWRPGFSHRWIDPDKDDSLCPPIFVEFQDWRRKTSRAATLGLVHFGCCVRGIAGVHRWFTPLEVDRLRRLGFRLVDASALTVVCEGKAQIIGASRWPLAYLPAVDWGVAA